MKIKILGSSSKGNCYLLETKDEILVLEAGIPFQKVLEAINFQIHKIVGVVVSHAHQDHSSRIKDYLKYSFPVHSAFSTTQNFVATEKMEDKKHFKMGKFTITPFRVEHDVETFAFKINHPEMGNLLFATDTKYLPVTINNLNHIMIEANYDLKILQKNVEEGKVYPSLAKRIINGHFSIHNAVKTVQANDLSKVDEIILIHLSAQNSNPDMFKKDMQAKTGVPTYIAKSGMEIYFDR